jgi:glutamyl-tRNA reductase
VSNRLFHEALEAGKRVRHETAIGRSNASVASV